LNTYGYVDGNPVNAIDPTGLVKIYGNWCGPNWTGGHKNPWDELSKLEQKTTKAPVDAVDSCCQTHDKCHAACRSEHPCDSESRRLCLRNCDRRLYRCSQKANVSGPKPFIIEDYMRRSNPDPESNHPFCDC